MGGSNCCITFHTQEILFLFPVGGVTNVTVARFIFFFCPRAPERASHTEVVALPCPLSAQGAGELLLWLMFVSTDPANDQSKGLSTILEAVIMLNIRPSTPMLRFLSLAVP